MLIALVGPEEFYKRAVESYLVRHRGFVSERWPNMGEVKRILRSGGSVVINDIYYPEQIQAIISLGGTFVRIESDQFYYPPEDDPVFVYDYLIRIRTDNMETLRDAIDEIVFEVG